MKKKPSTRSPSIEISPGQQKTLNAICAFIARQQLPPTNQELADILGVQPPTVHQHIAALVRKGYVKRQPRKARGLTVLREVSPIVDRLVGIPMLGEVKAGIPMLAEENFLGEVLVEESVARRGHCFALCINGDSMKDAHIRDNDIVIVRQQPLAENGDIVVAIVDGDATVKRLYIRGDHIELRPENRRHRPIKVGPDSEFQILGKVIAVRGNVEK